MKMSLCVIFDEEHKDVFDNAIQYSRMKEDCYSNMSIGMDAM